jgi:hypothetical protein
VDARRIVVVVRWGKEGGIAACVCHGEGTLGRYFIGFDGMLSRFHSEVWVDVVFKESASRLLTVSDY